MTPPATLRQSTALIVMDDPADIGQFHGWLLRNRGRIQRISDNRGCGCCVDIYDIEWVDGGDPLPQATGGSVVQDQLLAGAARDAVIDDLLAALGPRCAGAGRGDGTAR